MSVTRIEDKTYPTRPHLTGVSLEKMSPTAREVHKKTSELLGQVFFAPILQKMRESPFKTDISSGGRGGEAFGQMMDGIMIKSAVSPTGHLTQRFASNIMRHVEARERAQKLLGNQGPAQKEGEHVDAIG